MAIQIPIASLAEPNLLQVDTVYQVTGLTASKSYDFVVTEPSGKFVHMVIAKEEALTTIIYEHEPVNGTVLDFATPAGVTSVFLKVTAVSGATPYLTMAASKAVTDTALVVPAVPETWYKVTSLTVGDVYEVKVSSEVPVTIQSGFGASFDLNALQYNPPQTLQTGSFLVTATAANMWLYVDGADPANISVTEAVPVVGMQPVQVILISQTGATINIPAGSPAGIYRLDFVANDPADATTFDAKVELQMVPLMSEGTGKLAAGFGPVHPVEGRIYTGNSLRGMALFRVPAKRTSPLAVASYTKGTTGTGTQIYGQFALTYIGNLSA
jgi:hypothetical protein